MRVLITGGSGKLGRATIDELLTHGHQVANLDLAPPREPKCRFMRTDFNDAGQTIDALTFTDVGWDGAEALVHLAAIPGPYLAPDAHLFKNNMVACFNVFHAARHAGIKNIVWSSSETILGVPFAVPPAYVPLDEDAPVWPQTAYALGKQLEEEMARHLCRWDPEMKLIGLRFSYVKEPAEYAQFPKVHTDPGLQIWNLWSYIDTRDAAQAVRLALEYPAKGFDTFIIASPDTVMTQPTAELMAKYFPAVSFKREPGSHESLLSSDKAKRLLGFKPSYSWRNEVIR